MPVQATLDLCERYRSGDCQTSALCSAATEGGEVTQWRGEMNTRRSEIKIAQNRKGKFPSVQEIKSKKKGF